MMEKLLKCFFNSGKFYSKLILILLGLSYITNSCNRIKAERPSVEIAFNRTEVNFGNNWQFKRLDEQKNTEWEQVNIPHTARIEPLVVNNQWQGEAVYRKSFKVDELEEKKWFIHFEGVMQEAQVTINDSLVESHKGGYLPFTIDATTFLKTNSENTIEVKVTNIDDNTIPPGKALENLDFNLFGGIYRDVLLVKTNKIYITNAVNAKKVNSGGLLVHFDSINRNLAEGFVKVHLRNEYNSKKKVALRAILTDEDGRQHEFLSSEKEVGAQENISFTQKLSIEDPLLWSTSDPHLYKVRVEVLTNDEIIDSKEIKTGIRNIELAGNAFYLNGEQLFINGTNRHQEYPYVGYAISDQAQYRDAYKIKEAGFNFVRLSHYPHDPAFLDAADELGLLVMNAIPGWQYYQEGEFVENAIQDIKDMARRDRNHPSIVFWENSLNESSMTEKFMVSANEVLQAELPYDDTFSAGWIDHPSYDLYIPARQHAKQPHYWNNYDKPDRPIFIAEYGDWEYYAQNAGFNQTAFSDLKEDERSSRQLRSSGESGLVQQALNYQEAFNSNLKGEQTVGQANWLMFDYNRGYADDLEASGISDIFRIPKFSYYFYKSQKAPYQDEFSEPMVFIANYWEPNSSTDIKVFSNTEQVALYLNGKLVERKEPGINKISDELPYPPFVFELDSYTPGELKAVGYIDNKEVASYYVNTVEKATQLELAVDYSDKPIAETAPDVVFIYARILDKQGNPVHSANNSVQFTIEGDQANARLIGGNFVDAEAGIASILLRTESFSGPLVIKASSEGLEEAEVIIKNLEK